MLPFSKVEPMAALVLQLLCGLDEGSALEGGQGRKEASPHVRETPEGGLEKGQGLQSGRDGWRMRNPPEDGQSEGRRLRAQRACGQRPDAAQPVTPPPHSEFAEGALTARRPRSPEGTAAALWTSFPRALLCHR